jgi:transposase
MNYNTQNAKIAVITEKTLVVGIDIGSESHFARAFDWRGIEYSKKAFEFSNSETGFAAFSEWILEFMEKHGKETVLPGMEPTGHYWFNLGKFLQDNGMKLVHVNPLHVKRSKELDDSNPSKNDRKDPRTIARLINEGRFSYPYIPEGIFADIRTASNLRYQAQEELTRIKNRMARWFSIYFPEYKDVYGKIDAVSGRMVLEVAPLPLDIVSLGAEGVNQIWRDAKLKGAGMKRARSLASAAGRSIGCREGLAVARMEIKNLLADYDVYSRRVEELLLLMEDLLSGIPYIDKLMEISGIGLRTVSGFIAEIGDISRFDNPKQLQKLAGYAIVENSSGKHKGQTTISRRGRKRLRYVLFEAALSVIGKNEDFRQLHQYYTMRPENPLKKMQSLIAIACKLIRVFYAMLTKGVDYDGQKMLKDIRRPASNAVVA